MSTAPAIAIVAAALAIGMVLVWLRARAINKWGIVDTYWSFSFAQSVILFAILAPGPNTTRTWLVVACTCLWSIRLGIYLHRRLAQSGSDDARYTTLAQEYGANAPARMLRFYMIQAIASLLLSAAIFIAIKAPAPQLLPFDIIAVAWTIAAVLGESLADLQLARFKAHPANAGKVCRNGLWRFSRHPNYFFEWAWWLALPWFAASSPLLAASFASAVIMYIVIVHKTGIPPSEEQALRSRGDAYRLYQTETNAFFPWFPRKSAP